MRTRCLISAAVTPAARSSAQVTTPCEALAIRASSCSTVLSWGDINALRQDASQLRPPWPTKTERAGFEPAMEREPHTRLAGECLQPLGHLSGKMPTLCGEFRS